MIPNFCNGNGPEEGWNGLLDLENVISNRYTANQTLPITCEINPSVRVSSIHENLLALLFLNCEVV